MATDPAALIDAIASRQMGVPPQGNAAAAATASPAAMPPGAGAPPPPAGPGPGAPPNPNAAPPTAQEQAASAGAPQDEGSKSQADAVLYEIEFGPNQMRKLTPEQIKSTFDRYSALNFEHAQMKPVLEAAKAIMGQHKIDPIQFAQAMIETAKRGGDGPATFGETQASNRGPETTAKDLPADSFESKLKRWEEENAASLPPGYKEMMLSQVQSQRQMQQMMQMMQDVMSKSAGVADAAKAMNDVGRDSRVQAIRQTIGNNVDRAQAALQLPDSAAQDFMVYASERGYTLEDFADPQLTYKVMQDFRNNMNSPEMERLRSMAQRRQAFTGSLGSTPAAGGAAAGGEAPPTTFDKLVSSAMTSRYAG